MKNSGKVYWICGLAGSGKTSVAEKFLKVLKKKGVSPILLDGDYMRDIFDLPKDYSYEGRKKLARIYSKVAKMLGDQGFTVIVSVIAMYEETFKFNRKNITNYVEVFLDVPIKELIRRDKKKLYSKALNGDLKDVVGVDIKAEYPKSPDIKITNYGTMGIDDSVKKLEEHYESSLI